MTGRGFLVAIEGPGGVGKSTTTPLVAKLLRAQGVPVFPTREPIDSPLGDLARHGTEEYRGEAMACLIAAGRYQHGTIIRPALEAGTVVVCDRYIASSLVLQVLDGVDREFVWLLNEEVIMPDLTVIITARPDVIATRLTERGTHSRYERMTDSTRIESAYYAEAGNFLRGKGLRVREIDASDYDPDEVARAVVAAITSLLKGHADDAGRPDVQPEQPLPGPRGEAAPVPGGEAGAGVGADGDGVLGRL